MFEVALGLLLVCSLPQNTPAHAKGPRVVHVSYAAVDDLHGVDVSELRPMCGIMIMMMKDARVVT